MMVHSQRLSNNDFLTLMDFSIDEILTILDQSDEFKHALANKTSHEHLRGKDVAIKYLTMQYPDINRRNTLEKQPFI